MGGCASSSEQDLNSKDIDRGIAKARKLVFFHI